MQAELHKQAELQKQQGGYSIVDSANSCQDVSLEAGLQERSTLWLAALRRDHCCIATLVAASACGGRDALPVGRTNANADCQQLLYMALHLSEGLRLLRPGFVEPRLFKGVSVLARQQATDASSTI